MTQTSECAAVNRIAAQRAGTAVDFCRNGRTLCPMIFYLRGGTCWRPEVKNMSVMVNSIFNGWRMEDVWLDR